MILYTIAADFCGFPCHLVLSEAVTAPTIAPPDERCHYCGGPNIWAKDSQGWAPFRMCHECLDLEVDYGELLTIETPEVVYDLAKHEIPARHADRRSSPGCNPQWEVVGRRLVVRAAVFQVNPRK